MPEVSACLAEFASEAHLRADQSIVQFPNRVLRMHGSAILVAEAILPLRG